MSTPVRDVNLGRIQAQLERRADGTQIVRSNQPLPEYPDKLTARLDHWANVTPKRIFIAQRGADGVWRQLTKGSALDIPCA
jgi:feruloyl-CoA synthase